MSSLVKSERRGKHFGVESFHSLSKVLRFQLPFCFLQGLIPASRFWELGCFSGMFVCFSSRFVFCASFLEWMWWWRDASAGEERGEERRMRKDRSVSSRGAMRERGASTSLLPMDLIGRILSHVADAWMWWTRRLLAGSGEWSHTSISSDCASGERIGGGRAIKRCQ